MPTMTQAEKASINTAPGTRSGSSGSDEVYFTDKNLSTSPGDIQKDIQFKNSVGDLISFAREEYVPSDRSEGEEAATYNLYMQNGSGALVKQLQVDGNEFYIARGLRSGVPITTRSNLYLNPDYTAVDLTDSVTMGSIQQNTWFKITTSGTSKSYSLANATSLPEGLLFFIENASANSFTLNYNDGTTPIVVIQPAQMLMLQFSVVGTQNGTIIYKIISAKETLYLPAPSWNPALTNGALPDQYATASGNNYAVLDFDPTTPEYATFNWDPPPEWDLGTLTYRVRVLANDTSGTARFGLQAVAKGAGDAANVAFGTAIYVTVTAAGAAYNQLISDESSAITVAGTPVFGDNVEFRVFRDAGDVGDTLTVDARLYAVDIYWKPYGVS